MQRGAAATTLDGPVAVTDVKKGEKKKKKKGSTLVQQEKKHEESVQADVLTLLFVQTIC